MPRSLANENENLSLHLGATPHRPPILWAGRIHIPMGRLTSLTGTSAEDRSHIQRNLGHRALPIAGSLASSSTPTQKAARKGGVRPLVFLLGPTQAGVDYIYLLPVSVPSRTLIPYDRKPLGWVDCPQGTV